LLIIGKYAVRILADLGEKEYIEDKGAIMKLRFMFDLTVRRFRRTK